MSNTYTRIYIHIIFAVRYRRAAIEQAWEDQLHKCITGIVQNNGHKIIAINAASDHLHLFIRLNRVQSISDLMRQVKGDSSEFINKKNFIKHKFYWQEGHGTFSNSRSQIDAVAKYIMNQKQHHVNTRFRDEYADMLKKYKIDYNKQFIFHDPKDE
ncbi:IS200/IS605 family transposase [Niabella yanshanensis]|uniref:IS200/IS605 family transposase n=1 Tax=Niabella yanshanensis TaxID=577386 RepID=A0ABZ0W9K7_9BACT|nr:IS200/IS605 family transposase [Niabella yanshanensis]WQD39177.1 IS200/IS605 family transposase [Niabella yanshanensis]